MNATDLLARIEAYDLDEPGAALTFSRRLARENRWTHQYACRVVAEYKRFAFLAVAGEHPVTPSEDVDQAWHLHLCYTRDYWESWCQDTLGRPLHHGPTKGGGAEDAKYHDWYARTLESYAKHFGAPPPNDIWPAPEERFARRPVWVDREAHWIVRKPPGWLGRAAAAAIAVFGIAGCTYVGVAPLFDSNGATFLAAYATMLVAAGFACWWLHRRPASVRNGTAEIPSNPWEIAYLTGRRLRVAQMAAANLIRKGAVTVEVADDLHPVENWKGPLDPIEAKALAAIRADPGRPAYALTIHLAAQCTELERKLENAGLIASQESAIRARRTSRLIIGAVFTIGVIKVILGIDRGRPVLFLLVLLAGVAWALLSRFHMVRTTRSGRDAIRALQERHRPALARVPGDALAYNTAIGTFGVAALDPSLGMVLEPPSHVVQRQKKEDSPAAADVEVAQGEGAAVASHPAGADAAGAAARVVATAAGAADVAAEEEAGAAAVGAVGVGEAEIDTHGTGAMALRVYCPAPFSEMSKAIAIKRTVPKVGMISLGCAKNLVDAEIMLGDVLAHGMQITNDASDADVLIVNTCAFIDSAKEESIEAIIEAHQSKGLKKKRKDQKLIVAGCMSQRFSGELASEFHNEVDAFIGLDQVKDVGGIIEKVLGRGHGAGVRSQESGVKGQGSANVSLLTAGDWDPLNLVTRKPTYIPDWDTPRVRLTPAHTAFTKIAEGCNHPCSFCVIPQMRGRHRSRTIESVVAEVRGLVAEGVKEINLISQDTTYYGMDLWEEKAGPRQKVDPTRGVTLVHLLRELDKIEGDFWVRLLYTHPAHWSDELIACIAECKHVARYVDMPLQHIHPRMLEVMRRETSSEHIVDLVARIRAGIPGIAIRTTFIVGFPGETDEEFEYLLDFIARTRFERLGVFTYSQEEGSRAGKMEGQLDAKTKQRRYKMAMQLQQRIAKEIGTAHVGRTVRALVDQPLVARAEADAPDIDGRILLKKPAPVGKFVNVRITGTQVYDLTGEVV